MNRDTKQKKAILKVLKGTRCHPDADWIYEEVKKEIPRISLGTIYRNLKLLKESGSLQELGTNSETNRFDGETRPHSHFRCLQCGIIFDLDEKIGRGLEARVARQTGFKVTRHNLEFSGLCTGCQKHNK